MTDAFIYDVVRTPRNKGKKDGALHSVKPMSLMTGLLYAIQRRNDLNAAQVDDIASGYMTPVGDRSADITKTATLVADWNEQVTGVQIDRFYASGLEAVNPGATEVRPGLEDLVLVGGVESMSHVPMDSDGGTWALDPETNLYTSFVPQGIDADLIATLGGFSRTGVGAFTLRSQQRAAKAHARGLFDRLLVPAADQNGIVLLNHDEFIRADSTLEGLAMLKPSFEVMGQMSFNAAALCKCSQVGRIKHVHTPGNSSGVVDGINTMLIGSEAKGRELSLKTRARIAATAVISTDLTIVLTGPAPATRKALAKTGLKVEDIDLFEVNEAFASVVMRFMKDMSVAEGKVDVSGGATTMGHSLGAIGYIILSTLPGELKRRNLRYGLAALCIDGGMSITTIIKRV